MIRGILRLGLVALVVGWVVDQLLDRRAAGGPPPAFASLAVIDAPIERVWDVLADIEGQPRWMHEMKAVTAADAATRRRRDARGGDRSDLRDQRDGPGGGHRVRAAGPVRDPP